MDTKLDELLSASELAELELSYTTSRSSERERKSAGSYYTPSDVASHFWNQFFSLNDICDRTTAKHFVQKYRFIEPSVGSGTLVFALLKALIELGVDRQLLGTIDLQVIDINDRALAVVENNLNSLSRSWSLRFNNLALNHSDFRSHPLSSRRKPYVLFGNPPFVKNARGSSKWKNSFADFLEIGLLNACSRSHLHLIVPLSITFSRDYRMLRAELIRRQSMVAVSNYDNIPDTLFKSGKPRSLNTNKANSQRCSILTVSPSSNCRLLSTELYRWSRRDRSAFLRRRMMYRDVSEISFDHQIVRPLNQSILDYLKCHEISTVFGTLISESGRHTLFVGGVSRNFISIRDFDASGTHKLKFAKRDQFLIALLILSSELFFEYWRTVGDGFHLTKANIWMFPITKELHERLLGSLAKAEDLWERRHRFKKTKRNSGQDTYSFDFRQEVAGWCSSSQLRNRQSEFELYSESLF